MKGTIEIHEPEVKEVKPAGRPAAAVLPRQELAERPAGEINGAEANQIRTRHHWEVVGPPPF